jgi:uroporphyrinogen decarboxylase
MTSKERMMRALNREKPDRLPVTIHQWQQYHLDTYMGGVDAVEAFRATGLDASIQYFEAMGQFWIPQAEKCLVQSPQWREEIDVIRNDPDDKLIEKYLPVARLNQAAVAAEYDRVGDRGILRGFVWGDQAGCWQHACCLMAEQDLIMEALDHPDWVHRLLRSLLERKLRFIEESLVGAKFDLIETGGGAGSDTVISPKLHREFCLPYDQQIHRAVHDAGHRVTYHTCGGMMHILDLIVENGTDASETLAPPGVGGNITNPEKVRRVFAGKVAMIGGLDQFNILTAGGQAEIQAEVRRLFDGFGRDGGYVCSASDHFFDTPVENLRAFAAAGRECVY